MISRGIVPHQSHYISPTNDQDNDTDTDDDNDTTTAQLSQNHTPHPAVSPIQLAAAARLNTTAVPTTDKRPPKPAYPSEKTQPRRGLRRGVVKPIPTLGPGDLQVRPVVRARTRRPRATRSNNTPDGSDISALGTLRPANLSVRWRLASEVVSASECNASGFVAAWAQHGTARHLVLDFGGLAVPRWRSFTDPPCPRPRRGSIPRALWNADTVCACSLDRD